MTRLVWIVEMFVDDKWEPTVGTALNREEGRGNLQLWKKNNPSDKFRLRKYAPPSQEAQ